MTTASRPRPKVMSLTESAAKRISEIMAKRPGAVALKLGVTKGGCAGMEYTMEWAEEIGKFDEVVEDKGIKLLIDRWRSCIFLGQKWTTKSVHCHPASYSIIPISTVHAVVARASISYRPRQSAWLKLKVEHHVSVRNRLAASGAK